MGPNFLKVYRDIYTRRLAAKHSGDRVVAETLKIVLNGSYGKFGSKYSTLYSPSLLIQVTMTGQLALLMLIEHLETHGVSVVSANTDGIVICCRIADREKYLNLIAGWELVTGFETEETPYTALYSRDVNNFIALKQAGGVKLKGAYASATLAKNPQNAVCVNAVINWLTLGLPIEETIRGCQDIRQFLSLRKVEGGAVKDGVEFGRVVRWYTSTSCPGPITYKVNGYSVPKSDNARALQKLPRSLPGDIDYAAYIAEARSILDEIGATQRQGDMLNAA
jgi:hypothetical protein